MALEFRILGPLEVYSQSGAVALGGIKLRVVLAVLLLHPNESVHAERLALALWGEDAPATAAKTVQVYVSRLRKALGDPDVLATTPAGYCLRVRADELDAEHFARLVENGRRALDAGEAEGAAGVLREALALWRGPPLAELAFEPFAQSEIARLQEQRLAALELRMEADLAAGRHSELVGELRHLVAANPTRERFAGLLMLALYRCGQQVDALEAFHDARRVLLTQVGVEPGPQLRRLHEAILRQDPSLEPKHAVVELPRELDAATAPPLVGRDAELAWLRERWECARTGTGALVSVIGARGIGKSRLIAELAGEVYLRDAVVLYAAGTGPCEPVSEALARAREATRPTLLVIDDADQTDADVAAQLDELLRVLPAVPVLALASATDTEAFPRLGTGALTLEPLDVEVVRAISARYAPRRADEDVPAEWLLEASGGVPRRVHELARQWARREAARRVDAVAGRTAARRVELRSMEAELTGDVVELQATQERVVLDDDDAPVVCPFKGLASFDIADAPYFFGREKLIAELVARLVGAQLIGIVGPSGSGKSSVMRAGLLPALASGVLPGSETWKQVLIRPGEHPLLELTAAMATVDEGERAVIAVDQFEETFTTCEVEAERASFIAELGRIAGERDGCCVVLIALRADFYGRCAAYPDLASQLAANHVLVRSMQRDELRRAIELPARRVGLAVDPELVETIVDDVEREPGGLPLLSTALLELWQRRDGRRLRHATYERTGGVHGAVARLAEDAFGQLDEAQRTVAKSVLMRLVGTRDGDAVERCRVALDELKTDGCDDVGRIVALLTDCRLLTVSSGTIELAHEALLREWPRLRDWIDADRDGLRIHRNLNAAARQWEELGRDDGALYRGVRLTEAIDWNEAQQPCLNETERAFLAASDAARQRDRVMRRRRIALAFGSLAVALIAITIVAAVSIVQGRKTASRELAFRSERLLAGDPPLALSVGLEALRRHDTIEAQRAVRQATFADRETAVIREHPRPVYRAALSPDESRIATAGDDGVVRILSLNGAWTASTINGHEDMAIDVSFSPDGKHVASVGVDGEVAISELDGKPRRVVLRLHGGVYARSVEYDADGRRLLIAVTDGTVRLIRVSDSRSSAIAKHDDVRVARFDQDGERVLSAGEDGYARLWDLTSGATASLPHGKYVGLLDASFSPDGRRVATAGDDGALRIWSSYTGRLLHKIALDLQPLYSVHFSADGHRIVTGGGDGVLRVSHVRGGSLLAELKGHRDSAYDAGFVGNGDSLYSTGIDGTVRIWALPRTATLPAGTGGSPFMPSFSPDGKLVLSGYEDGSVRLWNPLTGSQSQLPGHAGYSAAVYSANGAYILSSASVKDKGTVRLHDVKRHTSSLVRVPTHAQKYAAAIDPTGRRIASAGVAERAVVQAPDGGDRVILPDHGQVNWLAFSPDGKQLLSASDDGTVRTFKATSGASERLLHTGADAVLHAVYGPPDGKRVAAAGSDGIIRIWPHGGDHPIMLYGHDGPVNTIAFNPKGDRIVSGGKDGTVRIWDAAGGETIVVLHTHEGEVSGVAFSPNGHQVVSGADDGLRVSTCEVCGEFPDVLALARARPDVTLTAAANAAGG